MIAKLLTLNSSDPVSEISLEKSPVTLGRGTDADIRVVDRFASRLHCQIVNIENELFVQDMGSSWGTMVNGQPVTEAPLRNGDSLTVGISTFRVQIESSASGSLLSRIETTIKKLEARPHDYSPQVASS